MFDLNTFNPVLLFLNFTPQREFIRDNIPLHFYSAFELSECLP